MCKYTDKTGISRVPLHIVNNDPSIKYYKSRLNNFKFVSNLFKNSKVSELNLMKMNKS